MSKIRFLKLKLEHRFGEIINERPAGMKFSEYKKAMTSQRERLKKRLRSGFRLND